MHWPRADSALLTSRGRAWLCSRPVVARAARADDDSFTGVMQETLYLQRLLLEEVKFFHANLDTNNLDLRNWAARGPARIILLAAWMRTRNDVKSPASIDLRGACLTPKDAELLTKLLQTHDLLSVDVRTNESLGIDGASKLAEWLLGPDARAQAGRPFRSLCGVTTENTKLVINRSIDSKPVDHVLVVAELLANVWNEGITDSMSDKKTSSKFVLMRRSTAFKNQCIHGPHSARPPTPLQCPPSHCLPRLTQVASAHLGCEELPLLDCEGARGAAALLEHQREGGRQVEQQLQRGAPLRR
jgi:hypothetical protein